MVYSIKFQTFISPCCSEGRMIAEKIAYLLDRPNKTSESPGPSMIREKVGFPFHFYVRYCIIFSSRLNASHFSPCLHWKCLFDIETTNNIHNKPENEIQRTKAPKASYLWLQFSFLSRYLWHSPETEKDCTRREDKSTVPSRQSNLHRGGRLSWGFQRREKKSFHKYLQRIFFNLRLMA